MSSNIEDVGAEQQVWRDNWPSIAYATDYDYENRGWVDPESLTSLLMDIGVAEAEVPELTVLVKNQLPGKAGGYYCDEASIADLPEMKFSGAKHLIRVKAYKNDKCNVRIALHEGTHFVDDLRGRDNDTISPGVKIRMANYGGFLGTLAFERAKGIDVKTMLDSSASTTAKIVGIGFAATFLGLGWVTGGNLVKRYRSGERRAYKAQNDKELNQRYTGGLLID